MLATKKAGPVYYNIETLAKKTGLTRRTIHYYVQRGLLPRPEGGGRGHYYTDEHVQRIKAVQQWRAQGVPLEKMKQLLFGEDVVSPPHPLDIASQQIVTRQFHQDAAFRTLESAKPFLEKGKASHWMRLTIGSNVELHFVPGALRPEDLEAIERFILLRMKT